MHYTVDRIPRKATSRSDCKSIQCAFSLSDADCSVTSSSGGDREDNAKTSRMQISQDITGHILGFTIRMKIATLDLK